jgi:polyhydroxyalkanoate synthesis regulator phasin
VKSLLEFKHIVEEEKSDYSKLDALVRAGLANKAQLQRIHKIMDKMSEERPVFNSADREIMRNLFNRMADLITSNKQIYTKARQAVREEVELDEARMDSPLVPDPPVVLVIKRKAVRLYPDGTRIAMYWSDKLKRVFSVPYGTVLDAPVQAEEYIKELVEAEELLLNDGNAISLNEETKQQIINTYGQLEENSKEYFWQQLTESVATFGKLYEFCRTNSAK